MGGAGQFWGLCSERDDQEAGVSTGAGRLASAARCGRCRKNQAAPQVPSMIATSETQPW